MEHKRAALLWIEESIMKRRTNFDVYLESQLKDEDFAARFKKAGEAWDVAIHLPPFRRREKNPVNPVHLYPVELECIPLGLSKMFKGNS
jgi:hypothetical protein